MVDYVVIIQHEHQVFGKRVELVEQRAEDYFDRRLGRLDERQRTGAYRRRDRLQRGDHIHPERRAVVIALVQREPCSQVFRLRSGCEPGSHEGSLAEPRRRRNKR